jgi:cytochrome P450
MTSRDEHHPRRRHYWAPYFSQKSLSAYTPYIEARSDVFLEQLGRQMKSLGHVDLSDALHLWSHDIVSTPHSSVII